MSSESQGKTTGLQLLLAWVFVGVPLAWGLYQNSNNVATTTYWEYCAEHAFVLPFLDV